MKIYKFIEPFAVYETGELVQVIKEYVNDDGIVMCKIVASKGDFLAVNKYRSIKKSRLKEATLLEQVLYVE